MEQLPQIITLLFSSLATVGTVTWMISNRFSSVSKEITLVKEAIIEKLEYHEGHDDERFADLNNELWRLRLVLGLNDSPEDETRIIPRKVGNKVSRRGGPRKVY